MKVKILFTTVKEFKCKRGMSKLSAITRSKSRKKKTQEEAVKQTQSQQYRHQSDIIGITLLLRMVNPVPISHAAAVSTFRLQADKCRHCRYFLALEIK